VSRYQKCNTNLDFTEARDSEWQWHQLGRLQDCTSLQTDNHASTPPLSFLQAGCPSCRPTNSVKALKAQWNNEQHKQASASGLQKQMSALSYGPFGTGRTLHIAFYAFKRLPTESFTEYLERCSETV